MKTRYAVLPTLAAVVTLSIGVLFPGTPVRADVNVSGLSCQAPFLNQAQRLRWHEHYLLNPIDSQPTWVVCAIPHETDILPQTFGVWASGVKMGGVTTFPTCVFNVVSLFNENIPGVVDRPGRNWKFVAGMPELASSTQLWGFRIVTTRQAVINAVGDNTAIANYTFSVNCLLPPGYALQMVSLF